MYMKYQLKLGQKYIILCQEIPLLSRLQSLGSVLHRLCSSRAQEYQKKIQLLNSLKIIMEVLQDQKLESLVAQISHILKNHHYFSKDLK